MSVLDQLSGFHTRTIRPPVPDCVREFAKVMGHERDTVDRVDVSDDGATVEIRFSWSVRCCEQDETYEVPSSVLTAADVSHATLVWKLGRELVEAENSLAEHQRRVVWSEKKCAELREKIAAATGDRQ